MKIFIKIKPNKNYKKLKIIINNYKKLLKIIKICKIIKIIKKLKKSKLNHF
jgi:hypothetical protein